MLEPFRRSPLHGRTEITTPEGGAGLRERPFLGKHVLRVDQAQVADAVRKTVGVDLPVEPCTSARSGENGVLWIGPDEWWLVTGLSNPPRSGEVVDGPAVFSKVSMAADLEQRLDGVHHQIVDVTDYYTAIELSGPRARNMLMKLTTLDMHPRAFTPGRVAGSMFGRTQATIWLEQERVDRPVFLLFVRWTMADYLWCLLAEAGREFGMPGQVPHGGETWRLAR